MTRDCPTCGRATPQDAGYCVKCGSQLATEPSTAGWSISDKNEICHACQHALDAEFCSVCGSRLTRITAVNGLQTNVSCVRCGRRISFIGRFCSVCGIRAARAPVQAARRKWSMAQKLGLTVSLFFVLCAAVAIVDGIRALGSHAPIPVIGDQFPGADPTRTEMDRVFKASKAIRAAIELVPQEDGIPVGLNKATFRELGTALSAELLAVKDKVLADPNAIGRLQPYIDRYTKLLNSCIVMDYAWERNIFSPAQMQESWQDILRFAKDADQQLLVASQTSTGGSNAAYGPATPKPQPPSHSLGMGTINTGWYCALTKGAFEELTQASVVRDTSAISKLERSGEIVGLENGTHVQILGGIISLQIRVQDGPAEATVCYVPTEFVTK
jgi:hypothetical protein